MRTLHFCFLRLYAQGERTTLMRPFAGMLHPVIVNALRDETGPEAPQTLTWTVNLPVLARPSGQLLTISRALAGHRFSGATRANLSRLTFRGMTTLGMPISESPIDSSRRLSAEETTSLSIAARIHEGSIVYFRHRVSHGNLHFSGD